MLLRRVTEKRTLSMTKDGDTKDEKTFTYQFVLPETKEKHTIVSVTPLEFRVGEGYGSEDITEAQKETVKA